MSAVHFLDVDPGDCSIIQHSSGRVTMIDVCNAYNLQFKGVEAFSKTYNGKKNPVHYLKRIGVSKLHRFINTHPDMDHIDGIKDIFLEFEPREFWDTENDKKIASSALSTPRQKENWETYQDIRNQPVLYNTNRLEVCSGVICRDERIVSDHDDALVVLSPTGELLQQASLGEEYNDASCVILYYTNGRRILFCGDSHNDTWEHIMGTYPDTVNNVDVMLAPHHGRKSGRDWGFLDHVRPKLTIFGRAPSKYLSYDAWRYYKLPFLTRPQVGSVIVRTDEVRMNIYVTNYEFRQNACDDGESAIDLAAEILAHGGCYWGYIADTVVSEYL